MTTPRWRTPIYLDNNASTRVDPRVVECMIAALKHAYGNPSSRLHVFGRDASDLVEEAREQVARLIHASADEILFTSGATESCNLAIKGVAEKYCRRGNHIVTCLAEHEAVLEPCRRLESRGFEVTRLQPDQHGRVSARQVDQAITPQTVLVSVMAANNVVGSTNPIAEIGQVAKRRGALFLCDATQAIGKIPIDVEALGIDLLSLSAHKFYGPKGIGALYVRSRSPRVRLAAQIDGGGQEGGLRSGTLNVPGIVGAGKACDVAKCQLGEDAERILMLRDQLWEGLSQRISGMVLNGHPEQRLPNTLNITFDGVQAAELMQSLPDVAASAGSACTSGTDDPHYVLRAMGFGEKQAAGSVRFSLGRFTTKDEVDYCIGAIAAAVERLRRPQSHLPVAPTCPPGCCENPNYSDLV